ncbi:MAG: hypothetical protein K1W34_13950 [Lachnospiraceae bacterium]
MRRDKREVEVIIEQHVPIEQMMEKINDDGKRRLGKAIDMILEETKKCPKVKIIFTNRA